MSVVRRLSVGPEERISPDFRSAMLDALRTLALMLSGADGSSEFYETFIKVDKKTVTLTAEGEHLLAEASRHAQRHAAALSDLEFGSDTDPSEFTDDDHSELASARQTVNQIAWILFGAQMAVSQPTLDGIPGQPVEALFTCVELARDEYLRLTQAAGEGN